MGTSSQNLTILHYNDVYNVESRDKPEPIGGAARMLTAFKQFAHLNPLIIFCGDALSPSMCKLELLKWYIRDVGWDFKLTYKLYFNIFESIHK